MNILQFSPYFPPHKWGVETVAEEIADYWTKKWYWKVINITFDVWQKSPHPQSLSLGGEGSIRSYNQKWYKVFLLPSFDIIPNFPVPKFWKKEFWDVLRELRNYISNNNTSPQPCPALSSKEERNTTFQASLSKQTSPQPSPLEERGEIKTIVLSHTRFFLSSFIAGIFARKNKLQWIHIEHGSDYVKLSSTLKSKISYIYDKIIWKWIFKRADKILAISEACKKFIIKEFIVREVEVFYRGMSFENILEKIEKKWEIQFVFIWRLVKLKWVEDLIEVYKKWKFSEKLMIIWDGEERKYLEKKSQWVNIEFLWFQDKKFIYNYLQKNNCIVINSSYQEWMPTTVLEALMNHCPVIATDVWGTSEISDWEDLQLFQSWNIGELMEKIQFSLENYDVLKWKSFSIIKNRFDRENNIQNLFDKVR